jgi:hypothetical protein
MHFKALTSGAPAFATIRTRSDSPTGEEFIDLNSISSTPERSLEKSKSYARLIKCPEFDPEIVTPIVRTAQVEVKEV